MENVMQYVKPELLVLVPVLYLVAQGLKKAGLVANEKIPLALGGTGAALCALWLLGSSGPAHARCHCFRNRNRSGARNGSAAL